MDKAKKAKIQMMIGLLGAVFFSIFILRSVRWNLVDLPGLLRSLTGLVFLIVYIFGIVRRKLRMTRIAYYLWLIAGVIWLAILFGSMMSFLIRGGETGVSGVLVAILWLLGVLNFVFTAVVLWVGLRGLRRFVETEGELKVENTLRPETRKVDEK